MCIPVFTIFTPTYNRAYALPRLYDSLKQQTVKNFEWLIVDDGSTDRTEQLVKGWIKENKQFSLRYYKKENGGKPRAINYGVQRAEGRYFLIVDSDDFLTTDAIEKYTEWIEEIDDEESFIGVGAARGFPDGSYIKGVAPKIKDKGYIDATNLQRAEYNLDADMTEAYKTKVFRRFPMAEWPGEKFAPEQIALNEIALAGYKLRWHKDIVYVCEYMEDGLTHNSSSLERENPMGYAMMYNHKLKYGYSFKERFHVACQHIALSLYGKHPEYIAQTNDRWMTLLALPAGIGLSFRRRWQYRRSE